MLQSPCKSPQSSVNTVAIALAGSVVTKNTKQKHVALLYQEASANCKSMLLHHAWHNITTHEPWNNKYHWIRMVGIDPELCDYFIDWLNEVAQQSTTNPIPYSVIYQENRQFDLDGRFIPLNAGSGLTCATFLLALFVDYGFELLDIDSWPINRPGDRDWALGLLKTLAKTISNDSYLTQTQYARALKRLRPEEVLAAASLYRGAPLTFDEVAPLSKILINQIPA